MLWIDRETGTDSIAQTCIGKCFPKKCLFFFFEQGVSIPEQHREEAWEHKLVKQTLTEASSMLTPGTQTGTLPVA